MSPQSIRFISLKKFRTATVLFAMSFVLNEQAQAWFFEKKSCSYNPEVSTQYVAEEISRLKYNVLNHWICPDAPTGAKFVDQPARINEALLKKLKGAIALVQSLPMSEPTGFPDIGNTFAVEGANGTAWLSAAHVMAPAANTKNYLVLDGENALDKPNGDGTAMIPDGAKNALTLQAQLDATRARGDMAFPYNLKKGSGVDLNVISPSDIHFASSQQNTKVAPLAVRDLNQSPLELGEPLYLAGRSKFGELIVHSCNNRGINQNLFMENQSVSLQMNCPGISLSNDHSSADPRGLSGGAIVDKNGLAVAVYNGQSNGMPLHYFSATPLYRSGAESGGFSAYPVGSGADSSRCVPCYDHHALSDDKDFASDPAGFQKTCVIAQGKGGKLKMLMPGE